MYVDMVLPETVCMDASYYYTAEGLREPGADANSSPEVHYQVRGI